MSQKVLLLEDDPNLGLILQEHLQMNGFEVVLCTDGDRGLSAFREDKFDLCLVDIMMPKKDGFTFARDQATPLIFLTARSLKEDRVQGFKVGCDDYVTKPFSMEELLLRIQAVLRRSGGVDSGTDQTEFQIGSYRFDSRRQTLVGPASEFKLTSKENALLRLLCLNLNRTLERQIALTEIWGEESYFSGRSMDVFISKLRKHLKEDPRISITNVHGTGFKLEVKE